MVLRVKRTLVSILSSEEDDVKYRNVSKTSFSRLYRMFRMGTKTSLTKHC